MKITHLSILDYIKKFQYLVDEAFTIENSHDENVLTIGIYIKEIDERFYYGVDDIKAMVANKQRIDTSIYHDSAKIMAESINNTIDKLDNVRKSLPNLQRPSK